MQEADELAKRVTDVDELQVAPRVEKVIADRRAMGGGTLPLDWGMAETLAYATLVDQGYGVRLSGQDTGRGTFSHRHAVLHDQNREKWDAGIWVPLQHVKEGQPDFEVIDSVLSEAAVLGFEYGYATSEPNKLVLWEAQFGDFANGAQVVIDQFIAAGEVKWVASAGSPCCCRTATGQGPSIPRRGPSAIFNCAQSTICKCACRRLRRKSSTCCAGRWCANFRKPLIVMSPKSLLRRRRPCRRWKSSPTENSRRSSETSTNRSRRTCAA
jgi:2-oxoglutarate dehydrogenase E1 component